MPSPHRRQRGAIPAHSVGSLRGRQGFASPARTPQDPWRTPARLFPIVTTTPDSDRGVPSALDRRSAPGSPTPSPASLLAGLDALDQCRHRPQHPSHRGRASKQPTLHGSDNFTLTFSLDSGLWLSRYEILCDEHSRSIRSGDGKSVVNNAIGRWTKRALGAVSLRQVAAPPGTTSLIQSYTLLRFSAPGRPTDLVT